MLSVSAASGFLCAGWIVSTFKFSASYLRRLQELADNDGLASASEVSNNTFVSKASLAAALRAAGAVVHAVARALAAGDALDPAERERRAVRKA